MSDGHVSYWEWTQLRTEVTEDLQRLAELDILEVGELIVDAPEGSSNCYGPCEEDPQDQVWMQAYAQQAARLDALADHAEATQPVPVETDDAIDVMRADVEVLRALRIVELDSGFVEGSNCYVPMCGPEDEARATRIAGHLRALALATGNL